MATSQLNETATARDLLFGGQSLEPTDALARALHERGALKTPVARYPGVRSLAECEVAREADRLLSTDVFDLLIAGWKKYDALTDAARRTRDAKRFRDGEPHSSRASTGTTSTWSASPS